MILIVLSQKFEDLTFHLGRSDPQILVRNSYQVEEHIKRTYTMLLDPKSINPVGYNLKSYS